MSAWLGSRRRRRERGAVAVEAALVTPIFILLVFGIFEFGMLFKDWLSVSNSVRAGVRIASAEPRIATYATDAAANVAREGSALSMADVQELWVYRAAADGTPVGGNGGFGACTACVKFRWDGSAFTPTSDTWKSTQQNACQGDVNRMSVGVYLKYRHPTVTRFIFDGFTIGDHAVMSLEPIPATRGCK
jgi:Flp pilus assembly protein TadG